MEEAKKADANNKKPENSEIIGALELILKTIKYPCNTTQLFILHFIQ